MVHRDKWWYIGIGKTLYQLNTINDRWCGTGG